MVVAAHQRRRAIPDGANACPMPATARASRAWWRPSRPAPLPSRAGLSRAGARSLAAGRRGAERARLRPVGSRSQAVGPKRRCSLPGSLRLIRCSPPSPSRSAPPRRWPRRRGKRAAIPCSSSSLAATATSSGSRAVREAVPQARLIADANEAWHAHDNRIASGRSGEAAGVELVEQPLPAGARRALGAHRPSGAGLRRRVGA